MTPAKTSLISLDHCRRNLTEIGCAHGSAVDRINQKLANLSADSKKICFCWLARGGEHSRTRRENFP